jgi:chromosome segregation ATPase
MIVEQAATQVRDRQATLDELLKQQEAVSDALSAFRLERTKAIKLLASGDSAQRRAVRKYDDQIEMKQLHLEGLHGLIADARADLAAAEEELAQAQAEFEKEFAAFVRRREEEGLKEILAGLPKRLDRIYDKYADLCRELAELQIAQYLYEDRAPEEARTVLGQFIKGLPAAIDERMGRQQFRGVVSRLVFGVGPMIPAGPELSGALTQAFAGRVVPGLLNGVQVAALRREERRESLRKEFLAIKKTK